MDRYARQLAITGIEGQQLLFNTTILIVGVGGIGSPALIYLAAAGIGKLIIVDPDKVELSNLHRQILFTEQDVGISKTQKAYEHLKKLNSNIIIEAHPSQLNLNLALKLIPKVDLIIDASDNYITRYLVNDICVLNKKPLISCSILKNVIQLMLFNTDKICYRCIYSQAPPAGIIPNCESGVLGTVAGIAGTLTANLAINYLLDPSKDLDSRLYILDANSISLDSFRLEANKNCPTCKKQMNLDLQTDITQFAISAETMNRDEYFIVDIREPIERELVKMDDDLFFPIKTNFSYGFFLNYTDKKILIYCATDYRSKLFVSELREHGVDAYYLKNGISGL